MRLLRTPNARTPTQDASRWHPPERRLRVGSATHRVATWGQGPPLLLLNGIGGNIEMWEPLALRLPGRQLIMIDMPGTGGSPALRLPLRMSGYATLVVAVLDQLGIERTDVLGYSWGGALAQQLAHHAPGRLRALVLAATIPGLGGHPPPPWIIALMATPARYYSRTYLKIVAPIVFGSDPAVADAASGAARLRRPPSLIGYSQQLYAMTAAVGVMVARRDRHGMVTVPARCFIAIPAALQHRCGLRPRDRVLLAAAPGHERAMHEGEKVSAWKMESGWPGAAPEHAPISTPAARGAIKAGSAGLPRRARCDH